MRETPTLPDVYQRLPEAIKRVALLYVGDQVVNTLGDESPQSQEVRDKIWQDTAKEFNGQLAGKITELRRTLVTAYITAKTFPWTTGDIAKKRFKGFKDDTASLLAHLLIARITKEPGFIDYSIDVKEEAADIVRELGSNEELGGEGIESITLERVITLILTDKLKLTRQT